MEHLQTNERQVITVAPLDEGKVPSTTVMVPPPPQIITIAPAEPDLVFVPVYNPGVVYGRWPYPAYPPVYVAPPPAWGLSDTMLTGIAFAGGAAIVGSLWGWARPGWRRGSVDVNVNRFNAINVNRVQIHSNVWRHDVTHRGGLAYRNAEVNSRFSGEVSGGRAGSRDEFRGRMQQLERGGGLASALPTPLLFGIQSTQSIIQQAPSSSAAATNAVGAITTPDPAGQVTENSNAATPNESVPPSYSPGWVLPPSMPGGPFNNPPWIGPEPEPTPEEVRVKH
jgi:hypothetical protein